MTTLNTIIEEEKKEFERIFECGVNRRPFRPTTTEVKDFLTTAMQRAYEAGKATKLI